MIVEVIIEFLSTATLIKFYFFVVAKFNLFTHGLKKGLREWI